MKPNITAVNMKRGAKMNKPEYFYELACCNCPEKDRCLEQKEKKESLINALFSYIENENNKITIGKIKNQIPTLTRCDVVLAKQLQHLKAENEELKEKVNSYNCSRNCYKYRKSEQYKQALEEVHNLLSQSMDIHLKSADKHFSLIDEAIEIVNEVLKDE